MPIYVIDHGYGGLWDVWFEPQASQNDGIWVRLGVGGNRQDALRDAVRVLRAADAELGRILAGEPQEDPCPS